MPIKNDPAVFEKERQVLEMRAAGHGFQVIADNVGYASAGSAYNAYARALERTLREPAEQVRELALERLDAMFRSVWDKASTGDIKAIEAVLKLEERRAKLLGIDAPIKVQAEITDGGELDESVRRFAYLIAEARINAARHSDSEQISLGDASQTGTTSTDIELADLVDSIGSGLGQDENGRGVDSLESTPNQENTLGDGSKNFG